jgi:hypothetical protein
MLRQVARELLTRPHCKAGVLPSPQTDSYLMRDDISKLNMPASAKRYARRSGLKQMGPAGVKLFLRANKKLVNPGHSGTMRPRDEGDWTCGIHAKVEHPGIKNSLREATKRILGQ